ncbi:MAG: phosphoribosylanthranilate isomerase [Opitutaceae bacterium]|nr:phosphoribosylanthranilate isomerase [Opitutaceae bacterium]
MRIKFCGLTSLVDAIHADKLGADYLGFILHPKSPRYITLRDFKNFASNLPEGRKNVAVMVAPDAADLAAARDVGFDRFQLHYPADIELSRLVEWQELVGGERIWLAPRRPPETAFNPRWLEYGTTVLIDTYAADKFGGSGKIGNWAEFKELQALSSEHTWVLSGGLSPNNIAESLAESGARFLDINSGVETAPGLKDHAKMNAIVLAIHQQRASVDSSHV